MSARDYSKGFGEAAGASAPTSTGVVRGRDGGLPAGPRGMSRHGATAPTGVVAERGGDVGIARRADPTKRPWARHAGTVGGACAAIGLVGGAAALVFQGNWAAIIVLPILLGLAGFLLFWLAAMVLDTLRGL